MKLHLANTVKKLVIISGISGLSYYAGRQSLENKLIAVS
jgi:hypothetical protein